MLQHALPDNDGSIINGDNQLASTSAAKATFRK